MQKSKRLKKELSLFKIYALATGATLSSGFFLLPGLAAAQAGPAVILSYLIAALHLVPAVFCMAELSTAMPRAGGIYYFLDRSMGPLLGTIGGLGTWLALILKTAFALIGMGAYIGIFLPDVPIIPIAVVFAVLFGWINLFGAKKTGGFQVILVIGLLGILGWFMGLGSFNLRAAHFTNFFSQGFDSIYATAGLVYISYVGLTNIASVSEEVKDPEKNLPLGMFLALGTAILIYGLGTSVMTGIIPPQQFQHDLTPVATAAESLGGYWAAMLMTAAAVLAFFSVSNAAILSASRYPLAMSRDNLLPRFFRFLSKHRTPQIAIYATVLLIIVCLIFFDPTKIAKLASAFQLLLFALSCLAVIIMRESHIESYDPGYRAPFYPWMPFLGIIAPVFLIIEMGWYPALFTLGLITLGFIWYTTYGKDKVERHGAIYHYFARLGERRYEGLDRELRGILKEKGLRDEDPFDLVIARATLLDITDTTDFEKIVKLAGEHLAEKLNIPVALLADNFMQGTRIGATPVSHGVALPHLRLPNLKRPEVVVIRTRIGVQIEIDEQFHDPATPLEPVHAFFFLVSPEENPGQHLRLLAQIAGQADDEHFMRRWLDAPDEHTMRQLLLRYENYVTLRLHRNLKSGSWIGKRIRDLTMPDGSLIAIINRHGEIVIPKGNTVMREGDQLTIIGEADGLQELNYSDTWQA
ncbi:amino acid permease [bacterium]|nr:amino acid permease [bacterium]